jgi:hypothetical protein
MLTLTALFESQKRAAITLRSTVTARDEAPALIDVNGYMGDGS